MKRTAKLKLAIGVAAGLMGMVMGTTTPALAGLNWNWPVGISGAAPNWSASGGLTDGRFGGNPGDYIGCFYDTGSNSIECDAAQDTGGGAVRRITCTTYGPSSSWIIAVSGLNAASVLTFTTQSGGSCKSIRIWNESDYL